MGIRVLVVDDDKDLLTLINKFLVKEQPDFEVISTISAQDAVRKLEEEHFDAIVCDYYLGVGEMNGLELLEWLRASHSTIPFIMFTGRSREEVAIRALNLGADLYLKKDQEDLGNLFIELVHHIKSSVESAQIEKTLWEERSRFQKYLDVAGVMILALDLDGTVTLMNRRGCEILGYDHDEVIGKDWFKTFLPKKFRKETYDLFRSLMKGKVGPVGYSENLVLTKDGEERIIAWYYTVLTDESGMITGTLSSGEDITERKRAEEALRQSEQRYYDLLMTLPEGVGITDLDENFTYVNKALSDMLDYPVEELVQKNALDLAPADGRRKIKAETERRKHNGTSTYELQMIRKDGELVFLEVSALPQKDNQGNVIGTIGVTSNITERKQAEEALRDSESMFRSLFEQAPMGVARIGLDGAILQGNSSLALMLGYDTDELVGINVFDISTPEDEKIERQLSQELLQGTRDSYEMEKRFIRKDGEQIWGILSVSVVSNSSGEPIFTIGMVENITLRKKGEEALRDSQQLLKGTFNSLSDAILVLATDTSETANVAEIIDCNPAAETIFGYSRHELLGQKISMLHCDETEYKVFRESLFLAVEEKGFLDQFEFKMKRKDGTVFSTEHSVTPLKNEQGTRIGWVSVVHDITNRKRTEEGLRESEALLKTTGQMAKVGGWTFDAKTQEVSWTKETYRIHEVPLDQKPHLEDAINYFHPDEREKLATATQRALDHGEPYNMELRFITAKGKELWTHTICKPQVIKGKTVKLMGTFQDITERKKVEEALRESAVRFRGLFEKSPIGIELYDVEGQLVDANQATLDIFGISSIDGVKGFKLFEDPNLTDEVKDSLRRGESMTYQTAFDFELVKERKLYKTSKSGTIHLDLMISPMILGGGDQTDAYIVHVRDITTLKESEENLKQSEEKYHSLFDNTPVGLTFQEIVVDENGKPIDFIFIDVNEGFEALMGLKKDDIVGKSANHVLTNTGEPTLEWIDVYGKVALTGARARFDQYSEALGRWFSVTAYSPEKNFFITVYTDVTEQKKAYESLKQQKKELSDFAHTMSHDLNNYFFKIRGLVQLLESKGEIPEIQGIQLLIAEMSNLVQHSVVLADAGLIIDKKQKVDLSRLVRDVAARHLSGGIALVQGPLLFVMADEIKLLQVFLNLFKNAVEHGSPTMVEVQRYDSEEGVRIVVANDGKPIPDDLRPQIFQRGFTTGEKGKGFGLSIVKKLVEAHGWQIILMDTPETAFEILIPRAAG